MGQYDVFLKARADVIAQARPADPAPAPEKTAIPKDLIK
jgi:hypothetical protein